MEFFVSKNSSVSVVKQLQEQIKLAVAMGVLKSGDALPSIRDVEKQTGIKRSQIHRAYVNLRQSGLVILTHGKGAMVSTAAVSPHQKNEKCRQMSKSIVSRARRLGVSPTAFGRYLSRYAQEAESQAPFIAYVDLKKEIAVERAAEVSQAWQVPVAGLTVRELTNALAKSSKLRKILANHMMRDYIRSVLPRRDIDIIPIEMHYTDQTINDLAQIKPNSSLLRILPPEFRPNSTFILAQLRKWVKSPETRISSISTSTQKGLSLEKLLTGSHYDYILINPGLTEVPQKLPKSTKLLTVRMQHNPASLEAARIRAGVII